MGMKILPALVVAAVTVAALAGCAAQAPAPAPATVTVTPEPKAETTQETPAPDDYTDSADEQLIQQYRTAFPDDNSTDAQIVTVAKQMCQVFDNQGFATGMQTIQDTADQTGVSRYSAGYLAGEAVYYYCPEYTDDLLDYAQTQPDGDGA